MIYWANMETSRGFSEYPLGPNLKDAKSELGRAIRDYPRLNGGVVESAMIWPGDDNQPDTDGDPVWTWNATEGWRRG